MTVDIGALWDFDDPAASEIRFREALVGETGERALELQTQIARAEGLQGKYRDGTATLKAIAGEARVPLSRATVRWELEMGRLHNSAGRKESALPHFHTAAEIARDLGEDALRVDALHMIAIAGPTDEQDEWNLAALELAERSHDPQARRWTGSLLNNLGWTCLDGGRTQKALGYFERALEWQVENGSAAEVFVARWSVGRAKRASGLVDEALAIQMSLAQAMDIGSPDGFVYEEIGECLTALGQSGEARIWCARAHETLWALDWFAASEPERLERMKRLSEGNEES